MGWVECIGEAIERNFFEKIHAIVHSNHRYRLPVRLMAWTPGKE